MTLTPLDIARRLLKIPTAPFHEQRIMDVITELLDGWRIPYRFDRYGNLIARYGKGRGRRWALMAHTDHPGIEITSRRGNRVSGAFLGGVRPDSLDGAPVKLFGPDGASAGGTIVRNGKYRGEKRVTITLDGEAKGIGKGAFGSFDFGPPKVNQRRIAATACDDLMGCATTLSVLAHLSANNLPGRVFGVFTRAEEVGFAGAQMLAEARTLPDDTLVVSLECSMEMAGARQGQGPVIRVGDRATTFTSELEYHLHQVAKRLTDTDHTFRFQRQLMTGGSCEGTVFTIAGYRTIGLAYPLFGYHNMLSPSGIGQEEIDTGDYLNGVKLLIEAILQSRRYGTDASRYYRTLQRATARYRKRL